MVEDHSSHHESEDPEGLTPQELAAMRWQAIEAFNGVLGVSPMARRLGVKLIACMDARTRQCYPGEARIAAELGVHLSAVKKAKAELKEAGLINWSNPGGPRHLSHYSFNWAALLRCAGEAKQRGDKAVSNSIEKRRHSTHTGTMGRRFNSTHQGTMERHGDVTVTAPIVPKTEFHSTQIGSHSTHTGTPIVPTRVPDTTQDTTLKDITHLNTPSQATGGQACAPNLNKLLSSQSPPQQVDPKQGALEEKEPIYPRPPPPRGAKQKTGPLCHYPKLIEEFGSDPLLSVKILGMGFDQQTQASKLLKLKGKGREAAMAFLLEQLGAAA